MSAQAKVSPPFQALKVEENGLANIQPVLD
jgi:hypothetical protein